MEDERQTTATELFEAGEPMEAKAEQIAAAKLEGERVQQYDAETLNLATDLAEELELAKAEMMRLKGLHDGQKKIYVGLSEELGQLMLFRKANRHARSIGRQMTISEVVEQTDASTAPADDEAADDDGLWKTVPIACLVKYGLTEKDVKLMVAGELKAGGSQPVTTLGELQLFGQPYPGNPSYTRTIQDLKGCGEMAVTRLADANLKFWSAWNHHLHAEMLDPARRQDTDFWKTWKLSNPTEPAYGNATAPGTGGEAAAAAAANDPDATAFDGEEGPFYDKFAGQSTGPVA
jgi:hypothetical protein